MRYREVAMDKLKKMAGVTAAQYVKDGMVVGLGTGSTAYFFVEEIGRRMKEEGLQVTGVTTSSRTTAQAQSLGIPLKSVDDIDVIDVTVDGADEIDAQFNGIKGGGGALLMDTERYVTDMGNFIIDLDMGVIDNPVAFGQELKAMVGVVDHGLFNGMVNKVIVAGQDGVTILEANC